MTDADDGLSFNHPGFTAINDFATRLIAGAFPVFKLGVKAHNHTVGEHEQHKRQDHADSDQTADQAQHRPASRPHGNNFTVAGQHNQGCESAQQRRQGRDCFNDRRHA